MVVETLADATTTVVADVLQKLLPADVTELQKLADVLLSLSAATLILAAELVC